MREVYKLLSMCLDILNNWNGCEMSRDEVASEIENIMDKLSREM